VGGALAHPDQAVAAFVAARSYHVALGAGTILRDGAGAILGASLLAALGAGLGTLVRSQLGAVIGTLVWGFLLEAIVGGLFNTIGPYLPFTATTTLAGATLGSGGFGFQGSSSASPLPFFAAAALVACLTAVVATVAARTTLRRDIT
jgi:ABC-2 type transport system permease protein